MIDYEGGIIAITGPTSSGKSDIAIRLAKDINGYIINGDSRQIYKELNIGSAKPIPNEILNDGSWLIDGIEHYLFDQVTLPESFTLFEYQKAVQEILDSKKDSKRVPIIVGGSGMYIDCVIYNYDLKENRKDIPLNDKTLEDLQEMTKEFKGEINNSDWNNKHRLIRIVQRGGINQSKGKELNNKYFVMDIGKELLKERIRNRIDNMFLMGLEEENRRLLEKGYGYENSALNSIGYIEFKEYFDGKKSLDIVKEEIYNNTLAYVKRQITWFKRNKNAIWTDNYDLVLKESLNLIKIL
jgi:tRNA dimethylallyltransferase